MLPSTSASQSRTMPTNGLPTGKSQSQPYPTVSQTEVNGCNSAGTLPSTSVRPSQTMPTSGPATPATPPSTSARLTMSKRKLGSLRGGRKRVLRELRRIRLLSCLAKEGRQRLWGVQVRERMVGSGSLLLVGDGSEILTERNRTALPVSGHGTSLRELFSVACSAREERTVVVTSVGSDEVRSKF